MSALKRLTKRKEDAEAALLDAIDSEKAAHIVSARQALFESARRDLEAARGAQGGGGGGGGGAAATADSADKSTNDSTPNSWDDYLKRLDEWGNRVVAFSLFSVLGIPRRQGPAPGVQAFLKRTA